MHEYEVEKKMKKVKNVILYSRIDSDKYGTSELDSQEDNMREFCAKNDLCILNSVREIADGYLGEWSRPVLHDALEEARLGKNCVVMVSDLDRLSERASFICSLMSETRARFIAVTHGIYYKTMPMQFVAVMNEEKYKMRCAAQGKESVADTQEGKIRFAKHMKPAIQMMIDSGLSLDDLTDRLGIFGRKSLPSMDGSWWWTREDIEEVLKLG